MINKKSGLKLKLMIIFSLIVLCPWLLPVGRSYAISLNLATTPLGEDKGFITPVGITSDGTDTFVADYGANKIYKITMSNFSVTSLIDVEKPISVAFYNSKLYVITEKLGGKIYDSATGADTGITFGAGVTKPTDIVVSSSGVVYVSDVADNTIKTYNSTTGHTFQQ